MADRFSFEEFAKDLPQGVVSVLKEEGFDELPVLLRVNADDIKDLQMKRGHFILVRDAVEKLQQNHRQGPFFTAACRERQQDTESVVAGQSSSEQPLTTGIVRVRALLPTEGMSSLWTSTWLRTSVKERLSFPNNEVRLVLIGKTGVGKSSAGNTILGSEKFLPVRGFNSGTEKCNWQAVYHQGFMIEVTDTPGVCDTHRPKHEVQEEIAKCLTTVTPGPHAVLMVFKGGDRFTNEEQLAYDELKELFGPELVKYMILVFTGVDKLAEDNVSLKTAIEAAPGKLQKVLKEVDGRYVAFNNKGTWSERKEQRDRLLQAVRTLLSHNGDMYFSNDLMKMFERKMQELEKETHQDRQQIKQDVVQEIPFFLKPFVAVKDVITKDICKVM